MTPHSPSDCRMLGAVLVFTFPPASTVSSSLTVITNRTLRLYLTYFVSTPYCSLTATFQVGLLAPFYKDSGLPRLTAMN